VSTDQERIRLYCAGFDEWGRLDLTEGQLEHERSLALLDRHLSSPARVLDLGGGPGRLQAAATSLPVSYDRTWSFIMDSHQCPCSLLFKPCVRIHPH
jgi:hypothetical protein